MAHWIIDDHGFGGTYYTCSACGKIYWDILDPVSSTDSCPCCKSPINEDENVYKRNGRLEEPVEPFKVEEMPIVKDDVLENENLKFFDLVLECQHEAFKEGIRANSVLINTNMVRVSEHPTRTVRGCSMLPTMFCGMNVYLTDNELPDGYSFAVFEGPDKGDRLEEFESIGMEPDELRKAAEIYRAIKEVI